MKTELIKADLSRPLDSQLEKAAEILKNGGLVAFPTETVYGLGACALDADAASKIYTAKGRPSDNPLIIHISKPEENKLKRISWQTQPKQIQMQTIRQ